MNTSFNGWIAAKRLVFVNEIYEGKGWAAYNTLKTYVTDPSIRVNEKYLPEYSVPNYAHFILCSNSEMALRMEDQDRRFLVPTVTEKKQPPQFWQRLHAWLEGGGYGLILGWARGLVARHGAIGPGEDAPMTGRKRQLIEDSRSQEQVLVLELVDAARESAEVDDRPVVLVDGDIQNWLRGRAQGRNEDDIPLARIRGWLRAGGLYIGERWKIDGRKQHAAATVPLTGKTWPDVADRRRRPNELIPL